MRRPDPSAVAEQYRAGVRGIQDATAQLEQPSWQVSGATGPRHRPDDPAGLFDAAASCLAAAQGGVSGSAVGLMIPVGRRRAPWENMLRRSGRAPSAG